MAGLNRKIQSLGAQHNEIVSVLDKELAAARAETNSALSRNETLVDELEGLKVNLADYEDQVRHKDWIIDELLTNPGVGSSFATVVMRRLANDTLFVRRNRKGGVISIAEY